GVLLCAGPGPRVPCGRSAGGGDGGRQHRDDLHRGGTLRRREILRPRARRLQVRHRGLPGDQVPLPGAVRFGPAPFRKAATRATSVTGISPLISGAPVVILRWPVWLRRNGDRAVGETRSV